MVINKYLKCLLEITLSILLAVGLYIALRDYLDNERKYKQEFCAWGDFNDEGKRVEKKEGSFKYKECILFNTENEINSYQAITPEESKEELIKIEEEYRRCQYFAVEYPYIVPVESAGRVLSGSLFILILIAVLCRSIVVISRYVCDTEVRKSPEASYWLLSSYYVLVLLALNGQLIILNFNYTGVCIESMYEDYEGESTARVSVMHFILPPVLGVPLHLLYYTFTVKAKCCCINPQNLYTFAQIIYTVIVFGQLFVIALNTKAITLLLAFICFGVFYCIILLNSLQEYDYIQKIRIHDMNEGEADNLKNTGERVRSLEQELFSIVPRGSIGEREKKRQKLEMDVHSELSDTVQQITESNTKPFDELPFPLPVTKS